MDELIKEAAEYSAKMFIDITIGSEFVSDGNRWRCTDKGTRTIVAIKLESEDKSWYNGPPYAVAESVFDEYNLETVALTFEEWQGMFGDD
jgi:hypothetical protein